MKNALIAVASIVVLALLTFVALSWLASSAERKSTASFANLAPDDALRNRYPEITAANAAASRLEGLTQPMSIDVRPRVSSSPAASPDPKLRESIQAWLRVQEERADDSIDPLPVNLQSWIATNRKSIDAVAEFLASSEPPRWPHSGSTVDRMHRPLPNLLGQMQLVRILSLASLEAESRGDHAAAWKYLQASANLSRGLRERRELISQLVAIAATRTIAASARKLEPPVPAWFESLAQQSLYASTYDSLRFEMGDTAEINRSTAGYLHEVREESAESRSPIGVVEAMVSRPVIRWGVAENLRQVGEELQRFRNASPCTLDSRAADARIEASVPMLARPFGRPMFTSLLTSLARAGSADLAMEGTRKILAAKSARMSHASQRWPASIDDQSSVCRGERWAYALAPDGTASFRFTGRIEMPPAFTGVKVPLEFHGSK